MTVFLALCLFLLAGSSVEQLAPYSLAFRAVGIGLIVVVAAFKKGPDGGIKPALMAYKLLIVGVGFGVFAFSAFLSRGQFLGFLFEIAALFLSCAVLLVLLNRFSSRQLVLGSYWALLALCTSSLASAALSFEFALESGRLRGLFENANGLGFAAFLLCFVSLLRRVNAPQSIVGVSVAVICIVLSASRASMLAVLISLVVLAIRGSRSGRRLLLLFAAAISLMWLVYPGRLSELTLFRSGDSRSVGFEITRMALETSFWTGLGSLPPDVMVAGSPFAAGITGGALGIMGLCIMYLGFVFGLAKFGLFSSALVLAAIAHSLLESWVLAFSSPLLLSFFVILACAIASDTEGSASRQLRGGDGNEALSRTSPGDSRAVRTAAVA